MDEEDLEIRILLILSSRHSDIRIHSDEQVYDTKAVVCGSSKIHDILIMLIQQGTGLYHHAISFVCHSQAY